VTLRAESLVYIPRIPEHVIYLRVLGIYTQHALDALVPPLYSTRQTDVSVCGDIVVGISIDSVQICLFKGI